jgi:hypothetical protein
VLSSGHAALDNRTCEVARTRLRPTAAIDPDGAPVAAQSISAVQWIMPQ